MVISKRLHSFKEHALTVVHIIDYGVCNLGSVRRAFEECGADAFLTDDPSTLKDASHIVLPGVGAFADGMKALKERGWVEALREAAVDKKIPTLGICLGMQLLATYGEEGGGHKGLDIIPGTVKKISSTDKMLRVPHVGWNEIAIRSNDLLFDGIPSGSDFYFVHSYHFVPDDGEHILATTPYGQDVVSIVKKENVHGAQCHPEKSGRAGFQLIRNFLAMTC